MSLHGLDLLADLNEFVLDVLHFFSFVIDFGFVFFVGSVELDDFFVDEFETMVDLDFGVADVLLDEDGADELVDDVAVGQELEFVFDHCVFIFLVLVGLETFSYLGLLFSYSFDFLCFILVFTIQFHFK